MLDVVKVAGTDILKGTELPGIIEALIKATERLDVICDKFGKPKSIQELKFIITESVGRGIPLLWVVPGHMRIINGYDSQKNEVIFTDSSGPGFEHRRMSLQDAYSKTKLYARFFPKDVVISVQVRK